MSNQKLCCFYISTFHLFTIILPYINEKIEEGKKVELILQNDLSQDLKKYVKNVKSLNINTEEIINLEWKPKSELLERSNNVIYLIVGEEKYISSYERIIGENVSENEIISCYKLKNNLEISGIVLNHDDLLTTKGPKTITKFSQNEQKSRTI